MRDFKRGATYLTLVFKKNTILKIRTSSAAPALYPGLFYSTVNLMHSNLIPLLLVP